MNTGCNRDCGAPIDRAAPHVTVVRQVEQWDTDGNQCTVHQSAEVAVFHTGCAPTADDILDGLIDGGHIPAHGSTT